MDWPLFNARMTETWREGRKILDHSLRTGAITSYQQMMQEKTREFLAQLGLTGAGIALAPLVTRAAEIPSEAQPAMPPEVTEFTLTVNGKKYPLNIDTRVTLLDCLRERQCGLVRRRSMQCLREAREEIWRGSQSKRNCRQTDWN